MRNILNLKTINLLTNGLLNLRSGNATGGSNPLPSVFPANLSNFSFSNFLNHGEKLQNTRVYRGICSLFVAFLILIGEHPRVFGFLPGTLFYLK